MLKNHNTVNLYTSKDSISHIFYSVQENLGSREQTKSDGSMNLYRCLILGLCPILMNIYFHTVHGRIDFQDITL